MNQNQVRNHKRCCVRLLVDGISHRDVVDIGMIEIRFEQQMLEALVKSSHRCKSSLILEFSRDPLNSSEFVNQHLINVLAMFYQIQLVLECIL